MSAFVKYQTGSLLLVATTKQDKRLSRLDPPSNQKKGQKLQTLAFSFSKPLANQGSLNGSIEKLMEQLEDPQNIDDPAEQELAWAALTRALAAVYSEVMGAVLEQASQAEEEAEWWGRVERVGGGTAWYLLQTFPHRLARLGNSMFCTLRSRDEPITLRTFSPSSLDSLFPPRLLSHLLAHSFFPHLSQPSIHHLFTNPIELARQECRSRRVDLEKLRDRRAEALGKLARMRGFIEEVIGSDPTHPKTRENVLEVVSYLEILLADDGTAAIVPPRLPQVAPGQSVSSSISTTAQVTAQSLHRVLSVGISSHVSAHKVSITPLLRPSRLTRLWPRFLFLPPLAILAFRMAFGSTENFMKTVSDAGETMQGFWYGWVVEPIKGILNTVRSGGEDAVRVVSKDGLKSDMDSLERMVVSMATEKLHYNQQQLDVLSAQIRQGDLTPVLKIYEEDMKSPVKNAITGTLIRSLLIQIQKTKVDVDVALDGIDKLLKSQELTFGFVGVAPSLLVLYLASGWIRNLFSDGRGSGRYGGVRNREAAWMAMRRIERLLNSPPRENANGSDITPLTEGLLLVSINHLRTYALRYLPARSRLQDGFLEDIEDLQDTKRELKREDRLRILDRMWKSWGLVLGWNTIAVESGKLSRG